MFETGLGFGGLIVIGLLVYVVSSWLDDRAEYRRWKRHQARKFGDQ